MKNLIKTISRKVFSIFALLSFSSSVWASTLDDAVRTVQLSPTKTITLIQFH